MKRFYQTEWQHIQFSDFATLSATEPAGAEFYNAFYRELFRRCAGYDDLDASWRRTKKELADWIAARSQPGTRVLSVGCGLGYMESCLQRDHGADLELHVSECAGDALNWLRQVLPEERIHLAEKGVTDDERYGLIYLSAVDYALPTNDMIDLLVKQRGQLAPAGICLMISASYLEESVPARIKAALKQTAKDLLRIVGVYNRGQFWGWQRTRSEYRDLMRAAEYRKVEDGFIETANQRTYFIKGQV